MHLLVEVQQVAAAGGAAGLEMRKMEEGEDHQPTGSMTPSWSACQSPWDW